MTEHRLIGELAAALGSADADDQRLREAGALLRDDGEGLRELLEQVVRDPEVAAAVARGSYWHANGFAKLVLHDGCDPTFHVRLHVWTDGLASAPRPAGYANVHTHRWAFTSVVVAGALHVDLYEEADVLDPKAVVHDKFEYRSGEPGVAGALVPVGRCPLRTTASRACGVGDLHHCDVDTVHGVEPLDRVLTATVFVQGPTRARSALVYQEAGRSALEDGGVMLTPAEVVDLVTATLAAMPRHEA